MIIVNLKGILEIKTEPNTSGPIKTYAQYQNLIRVTKNET